MAERGYHALVTVLAPVLDTSANTANTGNLSIFTRVLAVVLAGSANTGDRPLEIVESSACANTPR